MSNADPDQAADPAAFQSESSPQQPEKTLKTDAQNPAPPIPEILNASTPVTLSQLLGSDNQPAASPQLSHTDSQAASTGPPYPRSEGLRTAVLDDLTHRANTSDPYMQTSAKDPMRQIISSVQVNGAYPSAEHPPNSTIANAPPLHTPNAVLQHLQDVQMENEQPSFRRNHNVVMSGENHSVVAPSDASQPGGSQRHPVEVAATAAVPTAAVATAVAVSVRADTANGAVAGSSGGEPGLSEHLLNNDSGSDDDGKKNRQKYVPFTYGRHM
jgi:hypothetical protein